MGKKSRAKSNVKTTGIVMKQKRQLMKQAVELFKMCVYSPSRQLEWDYYLKVYDAIEDFRKKHNAINGMMHQVTIDRASLVPAFQSWLKEQGVTQKDIDIHDYEATHGFGIIATDDIKENQLLVSIPRRAMMTYNEAKVSYLKELIEGNELLSVMPNVCLALYLHCEKHNPSSKYKPYIDILPRQFNTILYFTPEELKYLKGSSVLSGAINHYKYIVRQFALLYQVFNGDHQQTALGKIDPVMREAFTFDSYRWCVSVVSTRQNKIPSEVAGKKEETLSSLALIPMWDLFNHSTGPMSSAFDCQSDSLECLAMTSFKQGEQVTICYGGRSNADLLIHNGFVLTDNPFDKVKIDLGVSPKDLLYDKKVKLLNRLNCEANGQFALCSMNGNLPTSPKLLGFLRVFHMSEDELDEWLDKNEGELHLLQEVYLSGPIRFKQDQQMWQFLENRVKLLLLQQEKNLPTNIDELIVDFENSSDRSRLALKMQKEERKLLLSCFNFCGQFKLTVAKRSYANGNYSLDHHSEEADDDLDLSPLNLTSQPNHSASPDADSLTVNQPINPINHNANSQVSVTN